MKTAVLVNPFAILMTAFSVAFAFGALPWSTIYPEPTAEFLLFFTILLVTCALFYRASKNILATTWVTSDHSPKVRLLLITCLPLLIINLAYPTEIPILAGIRGSYELSIKEIELLPIGYPLAAGLFYFLGTQSLYYYIRFKKYKYLVIFALSLAFPLLFVQRGIFVSQLATAALLLLMQKNRISARQIFAGACLLLVVIASFGAIGTIRDSSGKYFRPIEEIGAASNAYRELNLPSAVFYSWLYLTSPLANFQTNTSCGTSSKSKSSLSDFFVAEIIPDVLAKRLVDLDAIEENYADCRITPTLNVGTAFSRAYSYLEWPGVYAIFFLHIMLFFICMIGLRRLKRRSSPYYPYAASYLAVFSAMTIFDNMIPNSARSLPLIMPFAFDTLRRIRFFRAPQK
ncbi:hypothetical protein [Hydrogenophaga electricum]|uniref:hypothetical protein n=1 Tax=Hydrogenophaga electricum TaxID=1230953 RepID=UPI0024E0B652|nr:hypothetical protein [Hydrogenophaga electricum]